MNDKPKIWHSPPPSDLGDILFERLSPNERLKVIIVKASNQRHLVYLYKFDDSDIKEGRSTSAGWFRFKGPSITDSFDSAVIIALNELADNQDK